jgi:hypothetical protein
MNLEPKMLFLSTGEGTGGEGEGGGEGEPKTLSDLVKSDPKYQEELNTMMAANRKKLTQQNQELVTQLEELKRNSALTVEQKDELQVRITQLEEQYMSKEELAKRESTKQQKEFQTKLSTIEEQSKRWERMYADSTIQRAWQDAAINGEVLEPAVSQVAEMFKHRTSLVERLEDGKPTGSFDPVVKFNDVNEDGKEVVLDLSPTDAIKRMKELPDKFGYLFKGTATSGIGGSRGADGQATPQKLDDLLKDPAKYAEWRKKNPDLDLEKLRR